VKIWASAVLLFAVAVLVASPLIWRRERGTPARAGGHAAMVLTLPSARPTPVATTDAPEPEPVTHRATVLQSFSCLDCHGVDRGFVMPEDHGTMPATGCTGCHQPAAEPQPVSLHSDVPLTSPSQDDCGLCHTAFAAQSQRAPASPGVCYLCHRGDAGDALPVSHARLSNATSTCIVCHQVQQLSPPAVPHRTEGWEECTFCHGPQRLTPLTGAHTDERTGLCFTCHAVVQPPPVRAATHAPATEGKGCTSCHVTAGVAPLPSSHDRWTEALCSLCHQPAQKDVPFVSHETNE